VFTPRPIQSLCPLAPATEEPTGQPGCMTSVKPNKPSVQLPGQAMLRLAQ
jgi:hypothetical protein